ncbi:hypothetical protein Glove_230g215 [Diversispora epigaea]|uniref:TLDc domain-containing protein n=1 Tax=Diversispora epigaea TaxID=1348612 RepID=A0A397IKJ8_9GLOM|nr:hypothetical protein Glove_230g215 [Diversispora epigaea]
MLLLKLATNQIKKTFTAHSAILSYRSSYFNKELKNIIPNINNIIKTITIQNVSAQVFEIILKYIYYGIIDTENIDTKIIYKLMIAANELKLEELFIKLESHLLEFEASCYRSSYFNKELKNIIPNINNIIKTITIQNVSAQVFEIILKYIYYGIIDTENIDTKIIYKLMIAANELKLEELFIKLESHLLEFEASWLKTNFSLVYNSIFKYNNFKNLEKFCNDIIVKHPSIIFESNEFTSLHESALVSILKRDDLHMKESEIWDYLIKWGTAQNLTLPEKLEEWSLENFTTLKTTLQQCLPLIRYFHISNSDVMDKIKPYKKILDKQLWDDLKQHLILPDRPIKSMVLPPRLILTQELLARENCALEKPTQSQKLFSTILYEDHAAIISSWIDYKPTNYSLTNNPYEFELILRGSEDGFAPRTFWDICHGHANTILISKVKGTEEIMGGFNPLAWDKTKEGWMKTNKSFIFSFKDGNAQNSILSRVRKENNALHFNINKDIIGPRFGKAEFMLRSRGSDFTKDCLNMCRKSKYYERSLRNFNMFSIVDYEVLKVIKKSS